MSDSTDDEAYDYDETGRESDDYSDDFGDETVNDDAYSTRHPRARNSAEPEEVPAFTHGASMATGADVSQAASSAAAATTLPGGGGGGGRRPDAGRGSGPGVRNSPKPPRSERARAARRST